jgi:hypothetical protein
LPGSCYTYPLDSFPDYCFGPMTGPSPTSKYAGGELHPGLPSRHVPFNCGKHDTLQGELVPAEKLR